MITDPRVFDDEHLPRDLMHREGAVETLLRAWGPTHRDDAGDEVIISGPSGVGKTALARHTLQRLARQADVGQAYVACLGASPATILRQVCRDVGADVATNASAATLQETLVDVIDRPTIAILDEADGLPGSDALELLAGVPQLSTVVITHDIHRWLTRLTSANERYGSATNLTLERYGVAELADILEARARAGLPPGAVRRGQLERLADHVAGVAREGIQALRAAAELADERGHGRIEDVDVDDSFERARHLIRESNLGSLPFHHHVLYALVHEAGRVPAATLHDRYDAVAEEAYAGQEWTPIGKRSRRNKLQKLIDYDLVAREGPRHDPHYVVVDEAVEPAVRIPCEA